MSWRRILAIVLGAGVLVAALVIVYATPFGASPPPEPGGPDVEVLHQATTMP